jgi:hypothetical protein
MKKEDCDLIMVDYWECPKENGAPILTMPNVPHALHGEGLQPRTIYGRTTWDFMRKSCYANAGYASEVSGEVPPKGQLHAHELFSYDYLKQEGVFVRCVALTKMEHDFIHSGRLLTMYRRGNPLYPKTYLLRVVENGFNIIYQYNKEHPDEEPLRCYATFLDYLAVPDLTQEMSDLIDRYNIKFYAEDLPRPKRWRGWHVIVGNKRYDTPYECQGDWEKAMAKRNGEDNYHSLKNPFSGEGFDEVDSILKSRAETKIAGCKNGRLSKRGKE